MREKKFFLDYIVVLLIVYSTDTISIPIDSNYISIGIAIITMLGFMQFLRKYNWEFKWMEFVWVFLPIICILASQLINKDSSFAYELKIVYVILALVFVKSIDFERFTEAFVNTMLFIAFVSLVVYMTQILDIAWWRILPQTQRGNAYTMFVCIIPNGAYERMRNFGPFWEPGVYQAYLNVAILLLLFVRETGKNKITKTIVLVMAVISTLSTTGYICLCIIFFLYYLEKIENRTLTPFDIVFIMIGISMMLYFIGSSNIFDIVFSKLSSGSKNRSTLTRLEDIKIYFPCWLKNPLFGYGITKSYNEAISVYSSNVAFQNYFGVSFSGSTSTTMRELSGFGIIYGIMRLVSDWLFTSHLSNKKLIRSGFFCFFLILLNTEDFIYSLVFNIIFMYGIFEKCRLNECGIQ